MHLLGMQATVPLLAAPLAELICSRAEIDRLRAENGSLRKEVAALKHQLDELKRLIFGAKSERFVLASHVNQPTLFDEEDAPAEMPPQQTTFTVTRQEPAAKCAPSRQLLPSHLPREVIMTEPEGDLSSLKTIGEVVTETLDYVPGKLKVIRRVRPKYVDPANEERGVIIAALPKRLIEKGITEPGLLAHVMIDKYVDHLPLYRQRARLRRAGISLPPSTLGVDRNVGVASGTAVCRSYIGTTTATTTRDSCTSEHAVVHANQEKAVRYARQLVLQEAYARHLGRFARGMHTVGMPPKNVWINKPPDPDVYQRQGCQSGIDAGRIRPHGFQFGPAKP